MTHHCGPSCRALVLLLCAGALGLGPVTATSQTVDLQPLLTGHLVVRAQHANGKIFAGLQKGGLAEWNPATGETLRILTRREGLGGHFVADLAAVGGRLWVATTDGGLTVISNPGRADESFRVYSSLLPSLKVSAVCGQLLGASERVYYGTDGQGIGVITGGLTGAYYTTQDGLISDTIVALAAAGDLLLIATPSGLSRFADNTFLNFSLAEADRVNDLQVGPDGQILAATASGLKRWNDEARALEPVAGVETTAFKTLAVDGQAVWFLAAAAVYRLEGAVVTQQALPAAPAGQDVLIEALTAGNGQAWVGGRLRTSGLSGFQAARAWLAPVGDDTAVHEVLPTCEVGATGSGFCGVAFDSRRRVWLGDFMGDGLAGHDGRRWYNVTQLATAANDSNGLFNHFGPILVMAPAGDALWFTQAGTGVIRFRPADVAGGEERWDLVRPGNSGMLGTSFVDIAVHPDGAVFFSSDQNDGGLGVDVLIDPDNWRQASSWLHLYPEVLGGNNIWAVGFERRDIVWFAVRGFGLQRWDLNGPLAGPGDPLTWDVGEQNWLSEPLAWLPAGIVDLSETNAIVRGPDGSLWAGGNDGLANFLFVAPGQPLKLQEWKEKTSPLVPGLLNKMISGLAFDHNGHLWALTAAGLNRLRLGGQTLAIDAYTDIGTYLNTDPALYSTAVIQPLCGPDYHHLAVGAGGTQLAVSGNMGATLITVGAAGAGGARNRDGLYLYPNPFPGESLATWLRLGGLSGDDGQRYAIEILDAAGQLVYRMQDLAAGDAVWDGYNRHGRRAASGLYLVKISREGQTVVKTLAVAY